jgi:hypothetical protein
MPYECSLVAVPADPNAGFNRSAPRPILSIERPIMTDTNRTNTGSRDASEIIALGEAHANRGGVQLAMQFIRERRGLQEFRDALLDMPAIQTRETDTVPPWRLQPGRARRRRAIRCSGPLTRRSPATGAMPASSASMSQEMARAYGRKPRGIFVPFGAMTNTRVMSTSGSTTGQALVPNVHTGFIEMLRNSARVLDAGATVMQGLQGNVDIPRQTAGATAEWVAEDGAVTPSDMNFASVTLTPKTWAPCCPGRGA